ncbi:MAG: hypothetical protein ABIK09_12485 [Pseudomonadota bacterium]
MGTDVIFICGPHAAGKSTILEALERSGGIAFRGPEVGKDLFYRRRFEPGSQKAAFEREVTGLELERDHRLAGRIRGLVGLESWHPGNLAYAAVRNPAIVPELAEWMRSSPLLPVARGIRLRLPCDGIRVRTRTFKDQSEWAAGFYGAVDQALGTCLALLGLAERTIEVDASGSPEEVLARACRCMGLD